MANQTFNRHAGDFLTSTPREGIWTASILLLGLCYLASSYLQKSSNFPLINDGKNPKSQFRKNAKELIAQGFQKVKSLGNDEALGSQTNRSPVRWPFQSHN